MVRVVAAGHVNWDVTLRVDSLPAPDGEACIRSQRRAGGGSAANVAVGLSRLDVPTGVIGSVGDDDHGMLATRELAEDGVDLTELVVSEGTETSVKYLIVDGDGEVMVLGNDGANEAITPTDVDPAYVRGTDCLHLTGQDPALAAHLAEIADDAGVLISVDPGRRIVERDFSDVVERADVVFVNRREAPTVFEDGLPAPEHVGRVVVEKRGADGAAVHAPEGTYTHPGFGVDPVDTTGAGDAFAAGYLAVRLDGTDHERALEVANACGALAARVEGARAAPPRSAVDRFLETWPQTAPNDR